MQIRCAVINAANLRFAARIAAMHDLKVITLPITEELKHFNLLLDEELTVESQPLSSVFQHVLLAKGKQLRPILVLLSAKLFGEINDKTYRAALFVETVHTATLIHDDVIDESGLRRGKPSVNVGWGNRTAVLSGDYLLSKAVLNLSENGDYDILSEVLRTACLMSEGELMQSDKAAHFDINESDYFNIITRKTATLMEVCCKTGAFSVDADRQKISALAQFGKYLGIAFQIRDDIFDYQPSPELGKPAGNDIREHNFTLPLIHCLNHSNENERQQLLSDLRQIDEDAGLLPSIVERVKSSGGIAYAEKRMQEYVNIALRQLEGLPQSSALDALRDLAQYCVERMT